MNIALIGPPGVGKGTHGIALAKQLNMSCCSTGELLRDNLSRHTAVGFMAQRYIESSEPVPDSIVNAMVAEWIWHSDKKKDLLFVGYPRTAAQAESLDTLLSRNDRALNTVLNLKTADQIVEQRLTGRIICQSCKVPYHRELNPPIDEGKCDHCGGALEQRAEDIPALIKVRLRTFRRSLDPLLEYYRQSARLHSIDAERPIAEVDKLITAATESSQTQPTYESETTETDPSNIASQIGRMISVEDATHASFDIILLGGPGSGKGTQAEKLRSYLNLPHIATGDLFRENLKQQTSLGKLAKSYMDRGALVPDDVTEAMVEERLSQHDANAGFILDGFPRTLPQAYALAEIMNAAKRRAKCVLYINVPDEEIIRRLSGRVICRDCQTPFHLEFKQPLEAGKCDLCAGALYQRDDDNPSTVRARLKTFHEQTGPIINYYQAVKILSQIDGEGNLDEVVQRSMATVDGLRPH